MADVPFLFSETQEVASRKSYRVRAAVGPFGRSFAHANPAMLPKHPGYPMGKAVDPVRG
jgi:hypothetical protein